MAIPYFCTQREGLKEARMPDLEEILQQQVELDQFFDHLAGCHREILFDKGETAENGQDLDKIRDDITVCLNDFCLLNDMLITVDGKINEEIHKLEEAKPVLKELLERQKQLREEREKWVIYNKLQSDTPITETMDDDSSTITIDNRYREYLDGYLKLVGASNTTLAHGKHDNEAIDNSNNQQEIPNDIQESSPSDKQTKQAISLLKLSHDSLKTEIKFLSSLLDELSKDSKFIEGELKTQITTVQLKQSRIDNALNDIDVKIRNILIQIGLPLPDITDISLTQKFLHLDLNWNQDKLIENKRENDDIILHSTEFIDLKIKSLRDQLTHKKISSTSFIADKNLWIDCISNLRELEQSLINLISNGNKDKDNHNIKPSKFIAKIQVKIDYLESLLSFTENAKIKSLINDEKKVLEMACKELQHDSSTTSNSIDVTTNNNTLKFQSRPNPFNIGRSPPKIGISQENVNINNNKKKE